MFADDSSNYHKLHMSRIPLLLTAHINISISTVLTRITFSQQNSHLQCYIWLEVHWCKHLHDQLVSDLSFNIWWFLIHVYGFPYKLHTDQGIRNFGSYTIKELCKVDAICGSISYCKRKNNNIEIYLSIQKYDREIGGCKGINNSLQVDHLH